MRKINFQQICYKNCRVGFRLVLQCTANLLGSRKSTNIYFHRLLVSAPTAFLFWSCILVRIIYTHMTDKISLYRIYWLANYWFEKINYFLPSKISVSKINSKNKNTIGTKTRGLLEWTISPFLLPVHCTARRNAT